MLATVVLAVQAGLSVWALFHVAAWAAVILGMLLVACLVQFWRGRALALQTALFLLPVAAVVSAYILFVGLSPWPLAISGPCLVLVATLVLSGPARRYFKHVCPACGSNRVAGNDFLFRTARCANCGATWPSCGSTAAPFYDPRTRKVPDSAEARWAPRPTRPPWTVVVAAALLAVQSGAFLWLLFADAPIAAALLAILASIAVVLFCRGHALVFQAAHLYLPLNTFVALGLVTTGRLWPLVVSGTCLLLTAALLLTRRARRYFDVICPACGSRSVGGKDFWFREARCNKCKAEWRVGSNRHPEASVF